MYCKKCNRAIDSDSKSCPYCGAPVSLSGGNGIWSTAKIYPSSNESDTVNEARLPQMLAEDSPQAHRKELARAKGFPVLQVLVIVCFLISLLAIFSFKSSITKLEDKLETAETALADENTRLADRLTAAEQRILESEVSPSPAPTASFTKDPTEETQDTGARLTIFTVEFYPNFSDYSTVWERRATEETEFFKLTVDELSQLGLIENTEISEGEGGIKCTCKLIAEDLQSGSDGVYRLGVYTKDGDLVAYSGEARLTVTTPPTASSDEVSQEGTSDET